jgi:hypothetical protein
MYIGNNTWLITALDAGSGHYKTATLWAADNLVTIKAMVVFSF